MATDRGIPTNLETALHRAEARIAELEDALEAAHSLDGLMTARIAELEAIVSKIPQPQFARILEAVAAEQVEEKGQRLD